METKNVMIVGVGGQGSLLASKLLGRLLLNKGYDIKVSEVHGMSQRGGSVSSEVRFGEKVNSPMIPAGEGDILVVLDITQRDVVIPVMKKDAVIITPEDIPTDKLSTPKALNVMLLGALSAKLPQFSEALFLDALKRAFPEKLHAANEEMFKIGRQC